jgi:signal transduction histidine kinase
MNQPETKKFASAWGTPCGAVGADLATTAFTALASSVLLGISDAGLTKKLAMELKSLSTEATIVTASSLAQLRDLSAKFNPRVIFLDTDLTAGRSLPEAVRQLAVVAPLVVLASVGNQTEIAKLIAFGNVEFIGRVGEFVPLAAALIERRLKEWQTANVATCDPGPSPASNLGELFRHEINNPLTGILGNAELVLAHREHLSSIDVQRLQTVVDLAVRLRESIRRIGSEYEQSTAESNTA